jgi:hypothetical protein
LLIIIDKIQATFLLFPISKTLYRKWKIKSIKIDKKARIILIKKAKINMVIYMSISWLKASNDRKSFKIFESFGMDVYKINDLEKTDEKIRELVDKNYTTIVISNEVASFSEDIIKKYNRIENVNIIIAPGHNKDNYT